MQHSVQGIFLSNFLRSFRPEQYFPLWVINTRGLDYVRRNLRNIENGQKVRSKQEAIQEFCEQASR